MPNSATKKMATDANINKLKKSIEDGVISGQMTRSATVEITNLMCSMVEAYKNMNVQPTVSTGERADSNTNRPSFAITSGGVSLAADDHSRTAVDTSLIDKTKSHLVAFCCLCDNTAIVEYPSLHLPKYTAAYVENNKNGMAYATCITCQRANKEVHGGIKAFDWAQLDEFLQTDADIDTTRRTNLKKAAKPYLGNGVKTLKIRNKPAYLTAEVIQRSLVDGCMIFIVHVFMEDDVKPQMRVTEHTSGNFFRL